MTLSRRPSACPRRKAGLPRKAGSEEKEGKDPELSSFLAESEFHRMSLHSGMYLLARDRHDRQRLQDVRD